MRGPPTWKARRDLELLGCSLGIVFSRALLGGLRAISRYKWPYWGTRLRGEDFQGTTQDLLQSQKEHLHRPISKSWLLLRKRLSINIIGTRGFKKIETTLLWFWVNAPCICAWSIWACNNMARRGTVRTPRTTYS